MAKPTTRQEFAEYCLRKLGKPVINIEVADEQVDDRIDEALETYVEKHYDATEDKWVFYELTQTDIDQGYIEVPDNFLSVTEVYPAASVIGASGSGGMFSYQYQIITSELNPWQRFDSIDYFMKLNSIQEISDLIEVQPRFRHIRHKNQLKIYHDYRVGCQLLLRVYEIIDPEAVWNDKWLKAYATALIKLQWGNNVSKFSEIQLLGGVTINGEQLKQEAQQEIELLLTQLNEEYMEPTGFLFG